MADTALVPDDGGTSGSRSTPVDRPRDPPGLRRGARPARGRRRPRRWGVDAETVEVRDGKAIDAASGRSLSYADLASDEDAAKAFAAAVPPDVELDAGRLSGRSSARRSPARTAATW